MKIHSQIYPPPNNTQQKMFDYQQLSLKSLILNKEHLIFNNKHMNYKILKKDPYEENRKIFNKEKLFL